MVKTEAKYKSGDMVSFRLVKNSPITYNGIVTGSWSSKVENHRYIYSISCMNFSMNSYSVCEEYIVKKLA